MVPIPDRFQNASASWPRCPRCGAPRITKCPACGTSGTSFPAADTLEGLPPVATPLLLCVQCDEPFSAEYAGTCEWCGYEFPNGFRIERPLEPERLPPPLLVLAGIALAVVIGLIVYFAMILSH